MEYKPEEQVFAFDSDDIDPAVMYKKMLAEQAIAGKLSTAGDATSSAQLSGVKRKFRADNGINYVWDDEEDCWVVDEDDDGEDSESENENEQYDDEDNIDLKYKQAMSEMSRKMVHEDDHDLHLPPNSSKSDSKSGNNENASKKPKKKSKKNKKTAPNNWIYITGLPKDITVEEIKSHFSKVGLIALSPIDQTDKIKLYKDEVGELKGDCSLCYHAPESVEMAINFLDGGYIRPSHMIQVTKAAFETKKNDVPTTEPSLGGSKTENTTTATITRRPKVSHAQVKTIKSVVHQALSWSEDDDIGISKSSALKIIVLQGMFKPQDLDDPNFLEELEEDVASECSKCGTIEKITVFSQNKNGIIIIKFSTSFAAQECVSLMNGRFFGGQRIRCFFWDGVTDYTVAKSEAALDIEENKRLAEYGDWLDAQDVSAEFRLQSDHSH